MSSGSGRVYVVNFRLAANRQVTFLLLHLQTCSHSNQLTLLKASVEMLQRPEERLGYVHLHLCCDNIHKCDKNSPVFCVGSYLFWSRRCIFPLPGQSLCYLWSPLGWWAVCSFLFSDHIQMCWASAFSALRICFVIPLLIVSTPYLHHLVRNAVNLKDAHNTSQHPMEGLDLLRSHFLSSVQ